MVTPRVEGNPAPLAAPEELAAPEDEATVTCSRLSGPARARLRVPVPRAETEAPGRVVRTLALAGNLDATTDDSVRDRAARCLRDQPDVVVIDLSELNFCDGAGVQVLRWVLRRATLVGTTVRVIQPGDHLRRVLTLFGADDLLAVIDSAAPPSVAGSQASCREPSQAVTGPASSAGSARYAPRSPRRRC